MHVGLQWVAGDASVRDTARLMRDRAMGFLLVAGAAPGQLKGVVTDRDLAIRACTDDRRPGDIRVGDIASTEVIVCDEDDDLGEAEKTMREEQKARLVVVNADGKAVGVLSLTDILLHDHPLRAAKTARGILAREAEGPHTPIDQIKLTPSTPDDEDSVSHQHSTLTGRRVDGPVKMFP
jgi:predicted transcriptional regulator